MFQCVTVCSVDLFVLISGYFSSTNDRRCVGKPSDLLFQSVAFVVLFHLAKVFSTGESISWGNLFEAFIPCNYFVNLYVVLYIVSPYINVVLRKVAETRKAMTIFMLVMILLFSVAPMLCNIIESIVSHQITGFSTIGRLGNQSGYNIVNFILLYCVGASLRLMKVDNHIKKRQAFSAAAICVVVISTMYKCAIRPELWHVAWKYDNLFVILLAASLFVLFKQFRFKSDIVNSLAKAAFVCFLIHSKILSFLRIEEFVQKPAWVMMLHLLVSLVVIYLVSWVVWRIYSYVMAPLFKRLDKVEIPTAIASVSS